VWFAQTTAGFAWPAPGHLQTMKSEERCSAESRTRRVAESWLFGVAMSATVSIAALIAVAILT
jgi:hypothetical protein